MAYGISIAPNTNRIDTVNVGRNRIGVYFIKWCLLGRINEVQHDLNNRLELTWIGPLNPWKFLSKGSPSLVVFRNGFVWFKSTAVDFLK